jgi:hypothetical protein
MRDRESSDVIQDPIHCRAGRLDELFSFDESTTNSGSTLGVYVCRGSPDCDVIWLRLELRYADVQGR